MGLARGGHSPPLPTRRLGASDLAASNGCRPRRFLGSSDLRLGDRGDRLLLRARARVRVADDRALGRGLRRAEARGPAGRAPPAELVARGPGRAARLAGAHRHGRPAPGHGPRPLRAGDPRTNAHREALAKHARDGGRVQTVRPRRLRLLFALFAVASLVLAGRLAYPQTFGPTEPLARATDQVRSDLVVAAHRGVIRDRNGAILATTVELRSLYALPSRIPDTALAARELGILLG